MKLAKAVVCLATLLLSLTISTARGEDNAAPAPPWYTDYAEACRAARLSEQLLLIVFQDPRYEDIYGEYLNGLAANQRFAKTAENLVICKLPTNYEVVLSASESGASAEASHPRIKLLSHPAFAELNNHSGVAIIDYAHTKSKHFGHVVNVYPFKSRFLGADQMVTMLNLPEGSLTQRTMIFAVLTHPERPASANGQFVRELAEESESHSRHQANIHVQGHHQWESRFHRINRRLGRGLTAQEVVAESWPGQGLVDAAEECVHSWRQSDGHWSAVRGRQSVFAFDIKRGRNGIWYATGLFGR
jgi:hypothetical protein